MTAPDSSAPVTVRVESASPYDVVIGRGLLEDLVAAAVATGASRAALIHPPNPGGDRRGDPGGRRRRRYRCPAAAGARCRGREEPDGAGLLLERLRSDRARPAGRGHRARRRIGHRPGRLRRRDLDARRQGHPGADHAAGHGRRRGRREDRDQHRRREEHGRRVLRADRRHRRRRHPGNPAAARTRRRDGRGRQVRVHRRPGDPDDRRGRAGTRRSIRRRRSWPS